MKKRSNFFSLGGVKSLTEFVNRFISRQSGMANSDYIPYGKDNKLPQEMISLIGNNGTAIRAMRMRSKYLYADGFTASGNVMVNPKQNANQLLAEIKTSMSLFQGFALQVLRNANGQIGEVHFLPFELVRKHPSHGYVVNTTLGTEKERNEWEHHPPYAGKEVTPEQLRELKATYGSNAEIAYFFTKDAIGYDYPVADWFAGEFDVRTGVELMHLDYDMVANGFMTSGLLTFIGNIDDEQEDENGRTAADYRDDVLRQFTSTSRNPDTGKSGRLKLAVFDVNTAQEVPVLQQFNVEKIISGSIEKRDDMDRRICRLFGMHPVLLGFSESTVLGNQQALANASEQAAQDVVEDQMLITEAFNDLFEGDFSISKFTPMNFISDKIMDDLTVNERRELVGFKPILDGSAN